MVYILLAEGFEEMEALVPADLLRRAGAEVALVGLDAPVITGSASGTDSGAIIVKAAAIPTVICAFANILDFSFNCLYVNFCPLLITAVFSGVFSTCFSNKSIIELSFL